MQYSASRKRRRDGNTALHVSIRERREEIARFLIQRARVLLDVRNKDMLSPLHYAAKYAQEELAMFMIDRGANFLLPTLEGIADAAAENTLTFAARKGLCRLASFVLQRT